MERLNLILSHKDQKLGNTWLFRHGTPSNYIIFKKLCGTGATHGEAKTYKRNSIILVPNTPVLKGKKDAIDDDTELPKYPNILAVYEGVSIDEVIYYLNSDLEFKKILCTPEAYMSKVKPAIEMNQNFDLYNDFFMLLDECEKIIKDGDFRPSIILPVNDFFNFKDKAMISATAMIPSDNRFELNNFKRLYIKPKFKYKQKISIINTNNLICALKEELEKCSDDKVFIFLNSAELIQVVIELLQIEGNSKVLCAEKSRTKLTDSGLTNVVTELGNFAKYNFLTSKFFNAVDIFLDEKPRVILMTDVFRKAFSMLDPYSDSIQILGRFRKGIKEAIHISNFNKNLKWKERERAVKYISDSYEALNNLRSLEMNALTEGAKNTFKQAIKATFINQLVKEDGELDTYLVDNFLFEQKVTGYYTIWQALYSSYLKTSYFRPTMDDKMFRVTDHQIINIKLKSTFSVLMKNVAEILSANDNPNLDGLIRFELGKSNEILKELYPEIYRYYSILGYEMMSELGSSKAPIKKLCDKIEKKKAIENPKLTAKIQSLFKSGDRPTELEIVGHLRILYSEFHVKDTPRPIQIKRYYDANRTENKEGLKSYNIKGLLKL